MHQGKLGITVEVLTILQISAGRIRISILYPRSLELEKIMLRPDHKPYVLTVEVFGTLFTLARTITVFIITTMI